MFDRDRDRRDRFEAPRQVTSQTQFPWAAGAAGVRPGEAIGARPVAREGFLTMSFVWMFLALLVSAATAAFVMTTPRALQLVAGNYLLLVIGSFVIAMVIQLGINRLGTLPALALLFVYSILMGATLGAIVFAFVAAGAAAGVVNAFLGASAIFGAASLYGVATKRDLTKLGGILFMGFIGLLVVMIVHMFIGGSTLNLIIGIAGVVIFTGLTAYFVQQLKDGRLDHIANRDSASVVGALVLYISFVNLFLFLLRIFGGNSRD